MVTRKKTIKQPQEIGEIQPHKKVKKKVGRKMDPQSIRAYLYRLFDEVGCDNVTVSMAMALVKKIRPDNEKFNKWHLYFHRKNYRRILVEQRIEERIAKMKGTSNES